LRRKSTKQPSLPDLRRPSAAAIPPLRTSACRVQAIDSKCEDSIEHHEHRECEVRQERDDKRSQYNRQVMLARRCEDRETNRGHEPQSTRAYAEFAIKLAEEHCLARGCFAQLRASIREVRRTLK